MNKKKSILETFQYDIEQENIIRILKNQEIAKPVFYVAGPTPDYPAPWRLIINDDLDRDIAIICAHTDSYLDIVAKNIPINIAAAIVEEINEQ